MASSINASTSGAGGVITTADNTGILNLQSAGTTVAALASTGLAVTGTLSASGVTTFAAGTAALPAITTTGDTNTGIFFSAADTIDFAEGGAACGQFDSSANFKFNSGFGSVATAYGCRAWVTFNGTGTVSINASGNVSSITDNGDGDYTVNFTTAMPDANYAIVGTSGYTTNGSAAGWLATNRIGSSGNESAPTTTSCRVGGIISGSATDTKYMQVSIFR
jgi:hypothetical protein